VETCFRLFNELTHDNEEIGLGLGIPVKQRQLRIEKMRVLADMALFPEAYTMRHFDASDPRGPDQEKPHMFYNGRHSLAMRLWQQLQELEPKYYDSVIDKKAKEPERYKHVVNKNFQALLTEVLPDLTVELIQTAYERGLTQLHYGWQRAKQFKLVVDEYYMREELCGFVLVNHYEQPPDVNVLANNFQDALCLKQNNAYLAALERVMIARHYQKAYQTKKIPEVPKMPISKKMLQEIEQSTARDLAKYLLFAVENELPLCSITTTEYTCPNLPSVLFGWIDTYKWELSQANPELTAEKVQVLFWAQAKHIIAAYHQALALEDTDKARQKAKDFCTLQAKWPWPISAWPHQEYFPPPTCMVN
jgi:hypothetical protein